MPKFLPDDRSNKTVSIRPVTGLVLYLLLCAIAGIVVVRANGSIYWMALPGFLTLFAVQFISSRTVFALEAVRLAASLVTAAFLPGDPWNQFFAVGLTTLTLAPLMGWIHALSSQKKSAESALKKTHERVRYAFEATGDGIWDWQPGSQALYLSPGLSNLLGDETLVSPDCDKLTRLVHPDDLEGVVEKFKAHYAGLTPEIRGETRVKDREGNWRWVVLKGKVTGCDPNGQPARITGTVFDIAEQKKAEQNLKESEMILRQVANNIREVFWLRDRQTRQLIYMRLSDNIKSMEATNDEVRFSTTDYYYKNIHPDDQQRIRKSEDKLYESGKLFDEVYRYRHQDGTLHWLSCRQYPVLDENGQFYRVIGVAEDITERKHAELALQKSEKRFRDMVERQGEGVIIVDTEENFVYTNPAAGEILGVPHTSLSGRRWHDFLDPRQLKVLLAQTQNRRQGIESSHELTIQRPDGQKRNILYTVTPRVDKDNQFIGGVGVIRDITERHNEVEHLRYLSSHDPLTGIHNRTYFEDQLKRLEINAHYPISIIMIDMDNLKKINDHFGHAAGDQQLIATAEVLTNSLRENDIIARIGGDEFAILMPDTDSQVLKQVIARLREQIAARNQNCPSPYPIKISIGGESRATPGPLKDTLKQADALMYLDKSKNRSN